MLHLLRLSLLFSHVACIRRPRYRYFDAANIVILNDTKRTLILTMTRLAQVYNLFYAQLMHRTYLLTRNCLC